MRHVLFLRVGPNGRVRNEVEAAGVGNVGRGREQLEGGLLLRVSDVDRDLSGTKVLQGRSRLVGILNPLNSLVLTSLPRGSGNRSSGLDSARVNELGWIQGESKGGKLTKMYAKVEGKTVVKANKRVTARIVKASKECERGSGWGL